MQRTITIQVTVELHELDPAIAAGFICERVTAFLYPVGLTVTACTAEPANPLDNLSEINR